MERSGASFDDTVRQELLAGCKEGALGGEGGYAEARNACLLNEEAD